MVAVSIQPQAYFVERVSNGRVRVLTLVGPGQDPHAYEPTPRQMSDLSQATLWFTVGVDFERALVPKASALYPGLKLVDTTAGIRFRTLEAHGHDGAPPAGDAAGGGTDPHVWLGREPVRVQAERIRDALSLFDPPNAGEYASNCAAFVRELDGAFDSLARELAPLMGKTVFVYHPAFGYFLDEFGIRQEAVETGGKEPTGRNLAALIEEARADGAKAIFVQAQFPASAADTVAAAIGGKVVRIDPLAADWLANIRIMGAALLESLP